MAPVYLGGVPGSEVRRELRQVDVVDRTECRPLPNQGRSQVTRQHWAQSSGLSLEGSAAEMGIVPASAGVVNATATLLQAYFKNLKYVGLTPVFGRFCIRNRVVSEQRLGKA